MTPTATYIAEENCLQEESQVEKPAELNFFTESVYTAEPSFNDEAYEKAVAAYNAHLATLRKIPCDISCKGLWADGQKLVVGKDYEVRNYPIPAMLPADPKFIAFPLVPVNSEDELWEDIVTKLEKRLKSGAKLKDIVYDFKKSYSLNKR